MTDDETQYRRWILTGHSLRREEAMALTDRIYNDTADLETRLKLLGYFSFQCDFDKEWLYVFEAIPDDVAPDTKVSAELQAFSAEQEYIAEAFASLTTWFIHNEPYKVNLRGFGYNRRSLSETTYNAIRECWLTKIQEKPNDTALIEAAAEFFAIDDKALSEKLYRDLTVIEPDKHFWHHCLARLLGKMEPARFADALVEIDRALEVTSGDEQRLRYITTKATQAFLSGDLKLASETAVSGLAIAQTMDQDYCGDIVHEANSILGRVALRNGDAASACEFLLKAGETKGSPVLGSFGPHMILAEELYDAGQHQAVVSYLNECKAFWCSRDKLDLLNRAIEQINSGIRPCFVTKFASYGCEQSCTCRMEVFL